MEWCATSGALGGMVVLVEGDEWQSSAVSSVSSVYFQGSQAHAGYYVYYPQSVCDPQKWTDESDETASGPGSEACWARGGRKGCRLSRARRRRSVS